MSSMQKLPGGKSSDEIQPKTSQPNMDNATLENVQRLIGIAESNDFTAARNAILMLGQIPFSEQSFQCLFKFTEAAVTGSGTHTSVAITALGSMGHPRAIARLVEIVASASLSCMEAAKALGNPRNNGAVAPLLQIALTHIKYVCVKASVDALEAIGTPEAVSALEEFYNRPARQLVVRYSGAEDASIRSSSDLGQVPVDEDPEKDLAILVSKNPFWYGTRDQMQEELKIYCSTYGLSQSEINRLKEFLDERTSVHLDKSLQGKFRHHVSLYKKSPSGTDRDTVLASLTPQLEERLAEADRRKQEILQYLLDGDTTQLENTIMRELTKGNFVTGDSIWACDFLILLPRIKQLPKLVNLAQSENFDQKILFYLFTKLLMKRTPNQVEERKAAVEVLSRLKDLRAMDAIKKTATDDPMEEVKISARNALAEINAREQALRATEQKESAYRASRNIIGENYIKAADAALLAGQKEQALASFRLACESGDLKTFENISARRVELEKLLGIKPASELMVLCLAPLLEYYRKQGSHQAQSCESRLRDARRKLAGKV